MQSSRAADEPGFLSYQPENASSVECGTPGESKPGRTEDSSTALENWIRARIMYYSNICKDMT